MKAGEKIEKFENEDEKFIVRYPEMNDWKDLLELNNSLVEEENRLPIKKRSEEAEVDFLSNKLEEIEKGKEIYLVLEKRGKVKGGANLSPRGLESASRAADVEIRIKKDIRDKELGLKFLKCLEKESKENLNEIKVLIAQLPESNDFSRSLFEDFGFELELIAEDSFKFEDGSYQDNIIYSKQLDLE